MVSVPPVRVAVIWRHRVLGEAVAASLAGYDELTVVGVTGAREEAVRLLGTERVDVALLDASVGLASPLELAVRLKEDFPRVRLLAFGAPSDEAAVALIEAGAVGCLSNEAALDELAEAVLALRTGDLPAPLFLAAQVAARIEELSARMPPPASSIEDLRLSEREIEVLALLARGLGNKEIARSLTIRTSTVKNHVHAILSKLEVQGRRAAIRRAYELGLLRGPLQWRTLDDER